MNPRTEAVDETAPSIRGRLLVLLLLPAIGILTLGTLTDYLTSGAPFRDAYDQALLDSALAIADHVGSDADGKPRLVLPPEAVSLLRTDKYDSIYFKVTTRDGRYVAGDRDLPDLARHSVATSRGDARYRDEPIRLVSFTPRDGSGPVTITVGETLRKRDRVRATILSTSLAVDLGEFGVILAMILLGVRIAMNPLHDVEAQIEKRSPKDLSALSLAAVPVEIQSVVQTLNRLFATVRATNEAQRRFIESAAHQLRTPLTGICAQLELMSNEERDPARQQRLLAVLDGARHLTRTTQQLLTLARSEEAANLHWERLAVDLPRLVEDVVTERIASADIAGIDLGAQIEPATVQGVKWLLAEALGNLVNNAIAYTPRDGVVTVHCGYKDGMPYLRVTDTGVGIPAAERERVMERFFRASNTRGTGSGLGLAIVHEVAQLHHARIVIDAGPGGQGASIEILFPASESALPGAAAANA